MYSSKFSVLKKTLIGHWFGSAKKPDPIPALIQSEEKNVRLSRHKICYKPSFLRAKIFQLELTWRILHENVSSKLQYVESGFKYFVQDEKYIIYPLLQLDSSRDEKVMDPTGSLDSKIQRIINTSTDV